MNFAYICHYPGCNRKFGSKQGLGGHIRQAHIIRKHRVVSPKGVRS